MIPTLRRSAWLSLLMVSACYLAAQAPAPGGKNGVAAVVNNEVITYREVLNQTEREENELKKQRFSGKITDAQMKQMIQQRRKTVLESLVETRLILQDYKNKGFNFPNYYFELEERQAIREQFGGDNMALVKTLEERGMTKQDWKKQLRETFIVRQMRNMKTRRYVSISPQMVAAYYQDHIRDFLQPEMIRLRMIFISPENSADPGAEAREVLGALEQGADFAALAQRYSAYNPREGGLRLDKENQRTAERENRLGKMGVKGQMSKADVERITEEVERAIPSTGWTQRENLKTELAEVAFKLRPGQTSGIVTVPMAEGKDSYFLLHVEEVKKGTVTPLSQIRGQIEATLVNQEKEKIHQEWIEQLKRDAYIERFL